MAAEIILYRKIEGDYIFRFYTLRGGDFQTLLAAVKSLSFRRFDDTLRAWNVKNEGIDTLKAQGFEVKPVPTIRVTVTDAATPNTAYAQIEYMTDNRRNYNPIKVLTIIFADADERAAKVAAIEERAAEARKLLNSFQIRDLEAWKTTLTTLK